MRKYLTNCGLAIFSLILFLSFTTGEKEKTNAAKKGPEQPNILFITTDYTRGVDLPIAGGAPFLKAPTLRKLCEEGAVFSRHSCVGPICMPARASIVTGHYPHSHSLWDNNRIPVRQPGLPLLTTGLKKLGYQTIGIGKMHFHSDDKNDKFDYDIRLTLEGKAVRYKDDDYEKYLEERGSSRAELQSQYEDGDIPAMHTFGDWKFDEELHADTFVGKKTVETIESDKLSKEDPWFMWVSFTGPHNPWNAPTRLTNIYREMDDLPLGDFVEGELDGKPMDYTRHRFGYGGDLMKIYDKASKEEKKEIQRGVRAGHYGMLSFIDEWLGEIVKSLEENGQLDNTIVVFSADHGSALFDNQMLHKGSSFPTQSLVPMVVWRPGFVKPGIRNGFTSHVDLYSTFLELAGNKKPNKNEGKSLVKMFKTPGHKVNDYNIIESTMVTSIMTEKWLAGFHHITGQQELYNLENDPMCHYNIASDAANVGTIEALKAEVVKWRKGLAKPGESINDDIFEWYEELGDKTRIRKFYDNQIKQYKMLVEMDDDEPGITGQAAQDVLDQAGIQ